MERGIPILVVDDPRAHSDDPEVREQDRQAWAAARDLAGVGRLTARWLEGEIWSQPAYVPNMGPDPETGPLNRHAGGREP